MNKAHLVSLILATVALAACSNKPVEVAKGNVSVVGAYDPQAMGGQMVFNEAHVTGQNQAMMPQNGVSQTRMIPEKATAICNDGTFSMAWLHEACLNNGGVKEAIKKYHAE